MDNSLLSKIDELKIRVHSESYDIITLNEIKPKNGHIPDLKTLQLPGYTLHTCNYDSEDTRGTCIYINNKFKSAEVKIQNHNFADSTTAEIIGKNNLKLLITCMYRSGTPAKAVANDKEMYNLLRSLSTLSGYQSKVIVGDFNLNKIKWTPDPELNTTTEDSPEFMFVECIRDTFLVQHITEPTRYRDGNIPTCDDLLFSSFENNISNISYNAPLGKSDHLSICCNIKVDLQPTVTNKTYLNYNKADFKGMEKFFSKDWDEILQDKGVQEATDEFEKVYNEAVEKCVPKVTKSSDQRNKPIWMNNSTYRSVKRKYSSWVRYLRTKQEETYSTFASRRNQANNEVRKARKQYEKLIAKECRKNPKSVWRYMKSTNKMSSGIPNLKKQDGSLTTSDKETAEVLNDQYYKQFTKEDTTNLPNTPPKHLLTEELKKFKITKEEVLKELKNLKPNKAPGIDGLHPRVLKELADVIAHPLTLIYKKSLTSEELPSHWLQDIITPIYKKGTRTIAENYRPVSLTCILCKILEKIIVKQIIHHIKANQLATLRQHGFTVGKSVTTNLLEVVNIWTEAIMHNIPVDVLYLDYQKAFDCVPHKRLIQQVHSFGISGEALNWIESFLSNRKQKVRVNGSESTWASVLSGIPQGSILGPILFSLFVNDIPTFVKSLLSMFADDTKIYIPLSSSDSMFQLQEDLWILEDWAKSMMMKFHPLKCKVLHIGKNNPESRYYMHNEDGSLHKLESVDVEKDLGVYTDKDLKFTTHCQNKINTANKMLMYIKHTFKFIDENMFLLLYKSMVRPHLEFASTVWNPHLKYNIDAVERVQRRATKMLGTLADLSYTQRLQKLKLETLEYRRRRADLLEAYRIMHGIHDIDQSCHCAVCPDKQMFPPSLAENTRGHQMKVQIQHATGLRKHYFSTRVAHLWNSLSPKTIRSKSINIFKHNLSHELPDKYTHTFSY